MSLEKAIEEIKKMFWGVLKGKFNPDEEEEVKAHLITNLATLTSYAKTCLPPEQQEEYENHFTKAKDALLKFDSAGPWFRELPEMIDTVYNIITHANMLQIEYHRFSGEGDDAVQFFQSKLETIEMNVASLNEDLKKMKIQMETILQLQGQQIQEQLDKEKYPQVEVSDEVEPEVEVEEELEEVIEEPELEEPELEEQDTEEPEEGEDITVDTQELIEGIELASQYEFEQEPFMQTIESEQESLKKLANLLSALDPGDDTVISPLTEKLMSIGEEDEIISEKPTVIEEGLSDAELEEIQEFHRSVSRVSKVLSTPHYEEDAAKFVSSIKETIAHVSQEKDLEAGEKSALTKIIEEETGELEKVPVQIDDIQNIIKHLESKRQKAIERIQQLEQALNSEKIDEEEWQELRIKAERHMLRVEDTLDGYKRYLEKLQSQDIGS